MKQTYIGRVSRLLELEELEKLKLHKVRLYRKLHKECGIKCFGLWIIDIMANINCRLIALRQTVQEEQGAQLWK